MLLPDTYYHIFNHAIGFGKLFFEEKNYSYFLRKYSYYIDPIADTLAWCLLPNHFHILIKIKSEEELLCVFEKFKTYQDLEKAQVISKAFSNFFSCYTQSVNKVYQRRGSLFIKNFKRKDIDSLQYMRSIILYIHLNPVKHGFTQKPEAWKWSSIHSFPHEHSLLTSEIFGSTEGFNQAHKQRVKDVLHTLTENYTLEIM